MTVRGSTLMTKTILLATENLRNDFLASLTKEYGEELTPSIAPITEDSRERSRPELSLHAR